MIHPSLDIKSTLGERLEGKKIVLCITGSVAAVRSSDIARLLMRHGAEVFPVMSKAACGIIHPDLMHWATGHAAVTELTGRIEHVMLAGNVEGRADLILIAPCTANTIGKIASGIDDTPVTTFATTAIGQGIPVVIVPAMHEPMYRHPVVTANIDRLAGYGLHVLMPRIDEGKAKIAENTEILDKVFSLLSPPVQLLKGKKILVTAGRTVEYIDPVRVISNNSSGKMGVAVAEKAFEAGADVTLIAGKITVKPKEGIRVVRTETAAEMRDAVFAELSASHYDVVAAAAAVGDWQPVEQAQKKISTHDNSSIKLELVPTPKIIDSIKAEYPGIFLVAFRALYGLSLTELLDNAKWRMKKAKADMIAVNDTAAEGAGFETDTNELYVITRGERVVKIPMASKSAVAEELIKIIHQEIEQEAGN